MPTYEYICPACSYSETVTCPISDYDPDYFPVCTCTDPPTRLNRRYSFASAPIFYGHFNDTVGEYVSSPADFQSKLSAASDAATLRTGIDHNYQPVDLRDMKPPDVDG